MEFRRFIESEEERNVKRLLDELPDGHRQLLKGYKFRYTPGNTLNGDNQHIGYIHKDRIVVAAPWNYSRAFTTLHEIAHLVWEYLMDKDMKKEWSELVKKTKADHVASLNKAQRKSLDQGPEEIFCMAYAARFSNHAPGIWSNEKWFEFMDRVAKLKEKARPS